MTVDNVTMDTDRDGIDIDCCRNTTVSNCRINSPIDDGLCPKSSFALGRNVITENMTMVKDRKSTRLNSSHLGISYAVFCLKKKPHTPLTLSGTVIAPQPWPSLTPNR